MLGGRLFIALHIICAVWKWTSSVGCVLQYLLDLHVITVRITLVILMLTCGPLLSVQSMWMSVCPSGTLNHDRLPFPAASILSACLYHHSLSLILPEHTPCSSQNNTHSTSCLANKAHKAGLRWFFPSLSCKYLQSLFGHYGVKVKQYSYYLGVGNFPKWASKCYAEAFCE